MKSLLVPVSASLHRSVSSSVSQEDLPNRTSDNGQFGRPFWHAVEAAVQRVSVRSLVLRLAKGANLITRVGACVWSFGALRGGLAR